MSIIETRLQDINDLYLKERSNPYPYEDIRKLQRDFAEEFNKFASQEIINADLNSYWSFIDGLSSGTIKIMITDALERFKIKNRLEKSFFDCFPRYQFLQRYDFSSYHSLNKEFQLHEKLRLLLLEVIRLHESTIRQDI